MSSHEAFKSREHETVSRRSRKGRSTFEVIAGKRGRAQVIGSADGIVWSGHVDGMSDVAADARIVAQRLLMAVSQGKVGAHTIDLERVTDVAYGSFLEHRGEIERVATMTGTDVTSWEQIVHADITDRSLVAVQRSYLSGYYGDDALDAFAAPVAVYRVHTPRLLRWTARRSVKFGRSRRNDPRPTCRAGRLVGRIEHGQPVYAQALIWSMVAPTDDTESRFVGHVKVARPASRAKRKAQAKIKRDARTIGTIDAPDTVQGAAELLANLNRGERVNLRTATGAVAVTRATSGIYSRQYTRDDGKRATFRTRSADTMAAHLDI